MSKVGKIKIKNKKYGNFEGHHEHRSGSGTHDSRPRRLKTRADVTRQAIREWEDCR